MNDIDEYEKEGLLNQYLSSYQHLINDYQHILLIHLDYADNKINDRNYKIINELITNNIKCDIKNCILYQRNMRNRDTYNKNTENNNNAQKHDEKALIFIDILDNLHSFFVHCYDTGFRVDKNKNYEKKKKKMKMKIMMMMI